MFDWLKTVFSVDWVKARLSEVSSHEGAIVAAAAGVALFTSWFSVLEVVLFAVFVWGVYKIMKAEW